MRKRKSIFIRIFMSTAAILLASFILLGASISIMTWLSSESGRESTVMKSAETVRNAVSGFAIGGRIITGSMLSNSLRVAADLSGFHILVTDLDGSVIAASDGLPPHGLIVNDTIMREMLLNGKYRGVGRLGDVYADTYFTIGLPVKQQAGGVVVGALFVSVHTAGVREMVAQFLRLFVIAAVVVLMASCAWAYYFTRRITRPINAAAAASREFARGNFSVRVPEDGHDQETRELAVSFNSMARSLERTEELRREFVDGVSHELKTPMTTIAGYIDGILDGALPAERHDHYLRIVSDETKRMSRLVAQMNEMSRVDSEGSALTRIPFDLCEAARRVLLSFEKRIDAKGLGIEMGFDLPVVVNADPDSITRVIYNLTDNAVKYADEGTSIYVSIVPHGDKAVFTITDTGKPIPPDARKSIFERFYKTDRSRKSEGLGLGLYIAKSIIRNHGGDIRCDVAGRRTSIRFTLALAAD